MQYTHPVSIKSSLLLLFTLFQCTLVSAQQTENKISISLHKMLQQPETSTQKKGTIPVLMRADVNRTSQFIREQKGIVKFQTKNIISALIDVNTIQLLNKQDFVYWIDCPAGKLLPLNDVMVKHNNVDSAFSGMWPLEQAYDGTGVVVGIIDAPFDYKHGDFTDAFGNTRIQYLWDQNTEGTHPAMYAYGNECDSTQLAEGTCAHDDIDYYYSHGTGVTGTAAGSGNATGNYRGVAPNADIVLVSLDFGSDFLSNAVDAVAYIFEKADAMGKPCVINTSFGTYTGSHDGQDITAQAIAELINEKPGRAVVSAAGNAGNAKIHLGYEVTSTPQFTWFSKLSYTNAVYFQVWADSADFDDVNFSISADDPADYTSKGSTPLHNILSDYDLSGGMIDGTVDSVYDDATFTGTVDITAQLKNGTYLLEIFIVPQNTAHYWRFSTSGNGRFDVWSTEAFTGYSNFITTLPDETVFPEIVNYKLPDTDQSIVGSWQCSDDVITVGSYVNRDTMTNYYGVYPTLTDTVGQLFYSSSHGPTRDHRIKPDITATGARVLSSGSEVVTSWLIDIGAAAYIAQDGEHFLFNGTSFASPCVAGTVALYLQKNPEATASEIKNALLTSAKQDDFTGYALPDNRWGYGKLNAFRALTGPWGCSADDFENPPTGLDAISVLSTSAAIQWDLIPNASAYQVVYSNLLTLEKKKKTSHTNHKILNDLLPSTMYACRVRAMCDDFGPSDWSDIMYFTTLPLKENTEQQIAVDVYPNPSSGMMYVVGVAEGNLIELFTLTGQSVLKKQVENIGDICELNISTLQNGMYTMFVTSPSAITTKQIVVAK